MPEDFVEANSRNSSQIPMEQAPLHGLLHRAEYSFPRGVENSGYLHPTQALGPCSKKPGIRLGEVMLAHGPRYRLDGDAAPWTFHPPHGINEEDCDGPEGHEFKHSLG